MGKGRIFLSGPMRGVVRSDALSWRKAAAELLKDHFEVRHAMRGREEKETFPDFRLAIIRDLQDITRSHAMLVNDTFEGVSMIGTAMEVFWACQQKIPVIVFGNAHKDDYWLNHHIHARSASLEEACLLLKTHFAV